MNYLDPYEFAFLKKILQIWCSFEENLLKNWVKIPPYMLISTYMLINFKGKFHYTLLFRLHVY